MGAEWAQIRPQLIPLAKQTFANFQRHKAQWLAAAIAYFTMFAIAPLIIVIVEIAGAVLGQHQSLLHQLYGYLSHTAGKSAASGIQSIVAATFNQRRHGPMAQIVGWIVFFLAAIGLFSALQDALNTVWDVQPDKKTFVQTLRERGVAFAAVLGIVILLLASLALNAVLTVAGAALAHIGPFFPTLMKIVDFLVSFVSSPCSSRSCSAFCPIVKSNGATCGSAER
jgi:membrane protein